MLEMHIHTRRREGPIFIGSKEEAQTFIEDLSRLFGINHCRLAGRTHIEVDNQRIRAQYIKLGTRNNASCFYLPVPVSDHKLIAALKKHLNKNLENIANIKVLEKNSGNNGCFRRPQAYL
ncbi:MAG: hypothetical protein U9O98_05170 [Asgard group archaeon]|nr:hypothetical protein [Asgard group archaeon]